MSCKPELARAADYFSTDHLRAGLRTRALRGASVTLIAQASIFGAGIIGSIILARLLTPADFGLVTMVLSFGMVLQSFGSTGFIEATIQREEVEHEQISTVFWIGVALSLFLTVLFMALAPAIAWFYNEPRLKPIVLAFAGSILLAGLSSQHQALLKRNMQFYRVSAYEAAATFIGLAVAIALAFWGWGHWALVARWVVSPLVISAGAWMSCGWRPGLPAIASGVRPMVRFALNTYGNYILGYFGKTMDKILLGRFQGSYLLGNYDRAYQLANALPLQLLSALTGVAISAFSRLSNNPEKYRDVYLRTLSTIAFVCMPLSAILTLAGEDLILWLLGPQWSPGGRVFSIFGSSIGVLSIYFTHAWLHLSLGTPDRWFRWGLVAFAITLVLFVIGLRFGVVGVATAYTASLYILTGPGLWYAGRPIGLSVCSTLSATWKYFISALVAGLLCWLVLYEFSATSNVFQALSVSKRIVVAISICVSFYLALILALYQGVKPIRQLNWVLREMIPGFYREK